MFPDCIEGYVGMFIGLCPPYLGSCSYRYVLYSQRLVGIKVGWPL